MAKVKSEPQGPKRIPFAECGRAEIEALADPSRRARMRALISEADPDVVMAVCHGDANDHVPNLP